MNGAYGYAISRTGTCEALGWRMCGRCATGCVRTLRAGVLPEPPLPAGGPPGAVPLPVRRRAAPQQLNLSGEGVPNGKEK